MSRADRTVRGVLISAVSSVLAAASHSLAGGTVTFEAVIATAIIGLPLCVALAGRIGSVWRVAIAVGLSQFFYHWAFAGLGVVSEVTQGTPTSALSAHAAHLASLERFVPAVVDSASADALMWIMHAAGALISVAVITRGERAILALRRTVMRALPRPVRIPVPESPAASPIAREAQVLRDQLLLRYVCARRGPPVVAEATILAHPVHTTF